MRVHPGARGDEILGFADGVLEVRIAAPPVKGKANKALVALLAQTLGVSKSDVAIVRGETSRRKLVDIEGLGREELTRRLSERL